VSTDPKVLIAIVCLSAISLLLVVVVGLIRRGRAKAAEAPNLRNFIATPIGVSTGLIPMAAGAGSPASGPVATNLAGPAASERSAPVATNRATVAIGVPKPAFPPAPVPETSARKVISIIHDFGHPRDFPTDQRRYLTTREAFEILAEIRAVPVDRPIDFILHTPGGEAFACELIATAIKDRPNTTAYVPYCAMSAGTIVALACEKIVMGKYACLGPIDTQFYGFPVESYIRLLKEKPIASIDDELVLLAYLAEKELKTARSRACELLNKAHFGKDDACHLTDFLVAGTLPHSEQIGRDRAIELGVAIAGGDCPAQVYDMVEQRLRIYQSMDGADGFGPDYQVRATMLGNVQPPAASPRALSRDPVRPETIFFAHEDAGLGSREFGSFEPLSAPMSKLAAEEILRRLINAACSFVAAKFANHAPSKTEVRAMEAEIKAYLKITFAKFGALIDKNWAEIFEKVVAVFPD
jgi:hypothetical protein